jgi:hypothetical protein
MTEPDQPIVPGTPPQDVAAICPHVSALSARVVVGWDPGRGPDRTGSACLCSLCSGARSKGEPPLHDVPTLVSSFCRRGQREGSACGCDRILSREAAALLDAELPSEARS